MAVWVIRGGERGEHEEEALEKSLAILGSENLADMSASETKDDVEKLVREEHPGGSNAQLAIWTRIVWGFRSEIQTGDLIVMPYKGKETFALGEATGEYEYWPPSSKFPHCRRVRWIKKEVQRDSLRSDLSRPVTFNARSVFRLGAENAEQRFRVVAEKGIDPELDNADGDSARWDAFVTWAKLFYEWDEFYEREREYKLEVGKKLAAAKQALRDGNPDWHDLLRTAFRDAHSYLTHWRANDALLKLDTPRMEEALHRIWGLGTPGSVQKRVSGFQEFGPFSTPGVIASILLAGDDATRYPMYRHRPLRDAYRLTGYPSDPNNSPDAWERYEHALGFWDEFIKQSSYRSLEIQDRLDAQALVWCVTQYGTEDMPGDWTEDVKDDLIAYRAGKGTQVTFPPSPGPAPTLVLQAPWSPANVDALAANLSLPTRFLEDICALLKDKKQVIFQGPPGTGKTYVAQALAERLAGTKGRATLVQFHPSYAYEDFVRGFRARLPTSFDE